MTPLSTTLTTVTSTLPDAEPDGSAPDRRAEVVEIAARLLASEGPHALSLRRIASAAGGSTQLVYTLFGGKPGLASALYVEGFRRLAELAHQDLLHAPPPGDPARVVACGLAYRRFALAEPAFFAVMFGPVIAGFRPEAAVRRHARAATFGQIVLAAQQCLDAGTLPSGPDDPGADRIARNLWAAAHGVVSLELAGLLAEGDLEVFTAELLRRVVLGRADR